MDRVEQRVNTSPSEFTKALGELLNKLEEIGIPLEKLSKLNESDQTFQRGVERYVTLKKESQKLNQQKQTIFTQEKIRLEEIKREYQIRLEEIKTEYQTRIAQAKKEPKKPIKETPPDSEANREDKDKPIDKSQPGEFFYFNQLIRERDFQQILEEKERLWQFFENRCQQFGIQFSKNQKKLFMEWLSTSLTKYLEHPKDENQENRVINDVAGITGAANMYYSMPKKLMLQLITNQALKNFTKKNGLPPIKQGDEWQFADVYMNGLYEIRSRNLKKEQKRQREEQRETYIRARQTATTQRDTEKEAVQKLTREKVDAIQQEETILTDKINRLQNALKKYFIQKIISNLESNEEKIAQEIKKLEQLLVREEKRRTKVRKEGSRIRDLLNNLPKEIPPLQEVLSDNKKDKPDDA